MEQEARTVFHKNNGDRVNSMTHYLEVTNNGTVSLQRYDNPNVGTREIKSWRNELAYLKDKAEVRQIFGFVPSLRDTEANYKNSDRTFDVQLRDRFPDVMYNSTTVKYEFFKPFVEYHLERSFGDVYRSAYTLKDNRLIITASNEEALAFAQLNKGRLERDRFAVFQDLTKQVPVLNEEFETIRSGYPRGDKLYQHEMRELPHLKSYFNESTYHDSRLAQQPREFAADKWTVVIALKDDKQAQLAKDLSGEHGLASLRLSPTKSWEQVLEHKTQRGLEPSLSR